jgi:TRAP-type C4-dicarboxylate transport system permease small subunit
MSVRAIVRGVAEWLEWVEQILIRALFLGLVVVVFTGVLLRYVFRVPLIWGEELSLFMFIWLALLSGSIAVRRRLHFRMAELVAKLPRPLRTSLDIAALLCMATLTVVLGWQGYNLAASGLAEQAPALRVPMVWVYAAYPVGAASMMVFLLEGFLVGPPTSGGA